MVKSVPVHRLIQQVLCFSVPLQLNTISQLGCDCFSRNPESLFNRHPSKLQRDEIKKNSKFFQTVCIHSQDYKVSTQKANSKTAHHHEKILILFNKTIRSLWFSGT
jgi:hypothetical protein